MSYDRQTAPLWLSAGLFGDMTAGALIPHICTIDLDAIQFGGLMAGAWWGLSEASNDCAD